MIKSTLTALFPGFVFAMMLADFAAAQNLKVSSLSAEFLHNPLGLDVAAPRLSWKLESSQRKTMQAVYEIEVGLLQRNTTAVDHIVWKTGQVKSDQSALIKYGGPALQTNTKYYWRVRVADNHGNKSAWSAVNYWQTGILQPNKWTAKWITTTMADTLAGPSPYFRKTFSIGKKIKSATAFITAHGLYEARINGKRIGRDYFTPGWTSYSNRLLYQTYDVTALLQNGKNAVGLVLGDGWYRGFLAFDGKRNLYGNHVSALLQMEVEFTDGSKEVIQTDNSWKYARGPIRAADIYNGETYDARAEITGWDHAVFNDQKWEPVSLLAAGTEKLEASISPPAAQHEEFKPKQVIITPKGETVIDFGQNLVGWVKWNVKGKRGDSIKLYHGEVLDKQGNFYNANLRSAKALTTYILKGGAIESYEPHFSYQGFRYLKVVGYPGKINPDDFTAVAIYANMQPTGTFSTSNALLNQLQHNIQWGQKGNFLDVPTDCPQRDERLGWTGDAQVFSRTASFNMDVVGFFTKWMKDVKLDQLPSGSVPFVVPNVLGPGSAGSAGWADVATIIPWNMYLAYGDKQILSDQYSSMKGWVDFMTSQSTNNLWNKGFHFGDWLFYRPEDDNDGRAAITDKYLIAQTFYAHSTQLLINAAEVLGNTADAQKYTALLKAIKEAFLKEYVTANGRLVSGSQTAYVLALNFDMLPQNLRQQAADRLAENVHSYNDHLTTGFLGTPYLCFVLSRFGYADVAYKILLQDTYPSWLYQVKMGATTMWERWDGEKPDGSFQTIGMNSFNHYAYGAIGDWMYRQMVGLDTQDDGPGYKKIAIAPLPGGSLTHAQASLETLYGQAASGWTVNGDTFELDATIPPNTTASISLPGAAQAQVMEGGKPLDQSKDISQKTPEGKNLKLEVGSGTYHFVYKTSNAVTAALPAAEK